MNVGVLPLNVWAEVRSAENKHGGFLTGISKVSVCSHTNALFFGLNI